MREETKKRLNRMLWIERAKYAGIGLAVIAAIGVVFGLETLDLKITDTNVAGVVQEIDPLVAKSSSTAVGETVVVKLDDGERVRVIALKSRGLKTGDRIDVVAHHHATGRVTHSTK
jgi:hypothetical protein